VRTRTSDNVGDQSTLPIYDGNSFQHLVDNPFELRCPHCSVMTSAVPIAIPRFELVHRFNLEETGMALRCSSCNKAVFVRFDVLSRSTTIWLSREYELVSAALEPFDLKYLEGNVREDFIEALQCYAHSCLNAFASMSRRCMQSMCEQLGTTGTTKVQNQLNDLKSMGLTDDETFEQLKAIMLTGHDGAHPHLPSMTKERAAVLLELLKDVLYQLFVRPAKIKEANALRSGQKK
jgi:hypothetical protein